MSATVEIVFDSVETARAFMTWLEGQGEQDYFEYDKNIRRFDYNYQHLRIIAVPDDKE